MFSDGLRLPFYLPLCNVLNMVGVAPTQLIPKAWRILVGCCVIWWRALEEAPDTLPDLTGNEFFLTHSVCEEEGQPLQFCSYLPLSPPRAGI